MYGNRSDILKGGVNRVILVNPLGKKMMFMVIIYDDDDDDDDIVDILMTQCWARQLTPFQQIQNVDPNGRKHLDKVMEEFRRGIPAFPKS